MYFALVFLWAWYGSARGTVLSGVVAEVGETVAKAEVMLVNASNNIVLGSAYTDSRGTFRFAVKPGVFNTGTFKPDHVTVWSQGVVVRDTDISIRIELRDLEEIKIRDLRRIFGCGFRCNVGRIVGCVTGVTAGATAEKTSKARILIFSKCLTPTAFVEDPSSSLEEDCD